MFDPLHRISEPIELTFERLCFFIEGMPPQLNRPSVVVLFQVRNTVNLVQCHTCAYYTPGRVHLTAPAYSLQDQPYFNYKLRLSSMGSSFPVGISWHVHHVVSSPGLKQGQWEARYAIHASRQLSGEVLRYLKQLTKLL